VGLNFFRATLAICGFALLGSPAQAHHAFAAEFDARKPIMLSGTVTKVEWLNPHARVYVDVKPPVGAATNWELELTSPNGLMRQGWSRDSLKRGDMLTVSGYMARDGSHLAVVRTIRFADGRTVVVGATDGGPAR
jgi:hypothetical protein